MMPSGGTRGVKNIVLFENGKLVIKKWFLRSTEVRNSEKGHLGSIFQNQPSTEIGKIDVLFSKELVTRSFEVEMTFHRSKDSIRINLVKV